MQAQGQGQKASRRSLKWTMPLLLRLPLPLAYVNGRKNYQRKQRP